MVAMRIAPDPDQTGLGKDGGRRGGTTSPTDDIVFLDFAIVRIRDVEISVAVRRQPVNNATRNEVKRSYDAGSTGCVDLNDGGADPAGKKGTGVGDVNVVTGIAGDRDGFYKRGAGISGSRTVPTVKPSRARTINIASTIELIHVSITRVGHIKMARVIRR